jgi:predicted transcriptional regulator
MNTHDAVLHVLKEENISKYKMANMIDVKPIMIDHYLYKTRMRKDTADRFEAVYGIKIDDVYPTAKLHNGNTKTVSAKRR